MTGQFLLPVWYVAHRTSIFPCYQRVLLLQTLRIFFFWHAYIPTVLRRGNVNFGNEWRRSSQMIGSFWRAFWLLAGPWSVPVRHWIIGQAGCFVVVCQYSIHLSFLWSSVRIRELQWENGGSWFYISNQAVILLRGHLFTESRALLGW